MYISDLDATIANIRKRSTVLAKRKDNGGPSAIMLAIFVSFTILLFAFIVSYAVLRRLRASGKEPKYIPTSFLKRKWQSWKPRSKYSQVESRDRMREMWNIETNYGGSVSDTQGQGQTTTGAGVDRNTSVRSVMTLPAYSSTPKESEQVIGREGERGGMDTVVEFPETVDDEEARREDEMESLYQIRLARRRENEEREQRRRERREARDRGDWARLEELRRESRARALTVESNSSLPLAAMAGDPAVSAASLIAEHESRGRDRRVSSVAYASLGQVRHDGTRVRANSTESERGGLLAGAAPMGAEENRRSRASSGATFFSTLQASNTRQRSNSGLSVSTNASSIEQIHGITPPSTQPDEQRPHSTHSYNTSISSSNARRYTPDGSPDSDDIGRSGMPAVEPAVSSPRPPEYDALEWGDAPAYTEAEVQRRQASIRQANGIPQRTLTNPPRLPELNILPSINVEVPSEPNTPVLPSAAHR